MSGLPLQRTGAMQRSALFAVRHRQVAQVACSSVRWPATFLASVAGDIFLTRIVLLTPMAIGLVLLLVHFLLLIC